MNLATAQTIHIMLVSDQAAPNLLPALDPAMKPHKAVLLVSSKMEQRGNALAEVLRENGIPSDKVQLTDEHNVIALEERLLSIASEMASKFSGKEILLNVTGGNKLMALTAMSVARVAPWQIFYVDIDTDEIVWIPSGNNNEKRPNQPLSQNLKLNHYFKSYGFKLDKKSKPHIQKNLDELTEDLVSNVGSLEGAIGTLNYLSQEAESTGNLQIKLTPEQLDSRTLETLLRKFEQAGILHHKGETVRFASEAARQFANGGWLEYFVYQKICQVANDIGIRDWALNPEVIDLSSEQKNEIDIAFMANNRLFMIECKTSRMDDAKRLKAHDALYKLAENRSRIGGSGAKGMLVTYRSLPKDNHGKKSEKRLAEALKLDIVEGIDLRRFDEKIKVWVKKH